VAQIEAKHPFVDPISKNNEHAQSEVGSEKKKSHSSDELQRLIDNVADSVVKEVTAEFRGESQKPSRRVTVPKPTQQKKKSEAKMPLLNDQRGTKRGAKKPSPLESTTDKLHGGEEDDLPPEIISSDERTGKTSPASTPEDVTQSSLSIGKGELVHFQYPSRENFLSRGPGPERPGLEEMRELFKSKGRLGYKSHLKKTRPRTQKGKKKLTIPATTEGRKL